MNYPHPIIAREGWLFLAIALVASLLVQFLLGGWWALPLWVVTLFILQFFRDPPRKAPEEANAILAPADGRVVWVGKTTDPCLNREALNYLRQGSLAYRPVAVPVQQPRCSRALPTTYGSRCLYRRAISPTQPLGSIREFHLPPQRLCRRRRRQ